MADDSKTPDAPAPGSATDGQATGADAASGTTQMEDGLALKPAPLDPPSVIQTVAEEVGGRNIDAMLNVGLNVQIILGQSRMPISQLLKLSRGSVIELDKKIGEPVDVVINDRLVARGDLVKLAGDRIGVTLTAIAKDYVTEA